MARQFLQCLTLSLVASLSVACSDDDDDDAGGQTTQTTAGFGGSGGTGASTRGQTSSGGSGGGASSTRGMTVTTQGSGGATSTRGVTVTTTGSGGATSAGGATGTTAAGAGGEGGMAGATALMDDEIVHVARTANLGEVEQAEIALTRADDANVIAFAEMMAMDHAEAAMQANTLADAQGLVPLPNPVSEMLASESDQIVSMLESANDDDFDLVYMNSQLAAHQEVLTLLEETLIPQADDAALESYLADMRGHVMEHLDAAESVVETLE